MQAGCPHTDIRDQALLAAFRYLGLATSLHLADGATTGHGRLLEVEWASGRKLALRLDQGVSYWRAAPSNSRQACNFNLNPGEVELRGKQLAELAACRTLESSAAKRPRRPIFHLLLAP